MRLHKYLPMLVLAAGACQSVEKVSLAELSKVHQIKLSRTDPPKGAKTLGFISIHQSGFYLFGAIPMVPATLGEAFARLAAESRKMQASGVSNVQYEIDPPSPFKFSTFPIPDWSATVWLTGQAYRSPPASDPPNE